MITELEFDRDYIPLENEEGILIREYEEVVNHDVRHVWTIVEGDSTENLYALPGFHVVNRVGYVVTKNPWKNLDDEAMYMDYAQFDEENA